MYSLAKLPSKIQICFLLTILFIFLIEFSPTVKAGMLPKQLLIVEDDAPYRNYLGENAMKRGRFSGLLGKRWKDEANKRGMYSGLLGKRFSQYDVESELV